MSTINVTNLRGKGGASPNLPDGAVITGVVTATSFSGSGANLTGVANTDFVVGTAITMAVGNIGNVNFTKSASGAGATVGSFTGVTTYFGDGSGLTGVGDTIAPHFYNPSINDTNVDRDTGIGITFNKRIVAGSGTATLKIVNAGVAGTTIQSWGISSATIGVTDITLGALVSQLDPDQTFQLDIPSGYVKDGSDTNYVGTAYTFATVEQTFQLFTVGDNGQGQLGQNSETQYSSPVQIPGITWSDVTRGYASNGNPLFRIAVKTDGTLWSWGGSNGRGWLGQNNTTRYSSPTQIGSDTTWSTAFAALEQSHAVKTDGTLWSWGTNEGGVLAQNSDSAGISSPVQIYGGGTTWSQLPNKLGTNYRSAFAIKTDNTLWAWGENNHGQLGQNSGVDYSSPVQISGTTWNKIASGGGQYATAAIKTDGTLWTWGRNSEGVLGHNQAGPANSRSSPTQVPGTTWARVECSRYQAMAVKTDGTLWMWGQNDFGELGQNNQVTLSSPTQIPGTTWSQTEFGSHENMSYAIKTDNTLWAWGSNADGQLGQNSRVQYSSPVQITGTTWTKASGQGTFMRETA